MILSIPVCLIVSEFTFIVITIGADKSSATCDLILDYICFQE